MWSKLKLGLWRSSRSEFASQDATVLPPELTALGRELGRQAADLAALYPAGPAPRWLAAKPVHARTTSPKAGVTPHAHRSILRGLYWRWAAALAASVLAAALMRAWLLSPLIQSSRKRAPSQSPAVAQRGTHSSQPHAEQAATRPAAHLGAPSAAHVPKRAMPGTRPSDTLLTSRGNEAAVGDHADNSTPRTSPRRAMPAYLFESLSRPEQEAVLDLLNDVSPPEATLDL